ncbi:hypothetical protein Bbelb_346640 [Branchiostoma belcheri]|nr:hypothetical protein Bbelb_346640 [Branchiostoma belcheri]
MSFMMSGERMDNSKHRKEDRGSLRTDCQNGNSRGARVENVTRRKTLRSYLKIGFKSSVLWQIRGANVGYRRPMDTGLANIKSPCPTESAWRLPSAQPSPNMAPICHPSLTPNSSPGSHRANSASVHS